ncbi:Paraneoplastic antigen Ma1 [Holothuria leucospilota]|uniref:Paraneoplastic antigen Ma1 n=1 Tax=Holothuria leucospilota TaxID=206669 RepID=A0A9Q1H5Z3_HOLLE|nr:Paraneoplastic antigen Ma1 [Holothuria leucospilota]
MNSDTDYKQVGIDWCRKEDVGLANAILLVGQPISVPIPDLLRAIVKALPKGLKSIARKNITISGSAKLLVLCEHAESHVVDGMGEFVAIRIGERMAQFEIISLTEGHEDTVERLSVADLGDEMQRLKTKDTAADSHYHCSNRNYRKPRYFSGRLPAAKDEDEWETWIDQVEAQVKEWDEVPDKEIRRRIRESLRSPALDIIGDLKKEDPAAPSSRYLAALEMAFGSTDSGEELLMRFYSSEQKEGEKASEFVARLQQLLRKIVRKGEMRGERVNAFRMKQFQRGVLYNDNLLTQLKMSDLGESPNYVCLLNKVRKIEEEQTLKKGKRSVGSLSKKEKEVTASSRKAEASSTGNESRSDLLERLARLEAKMEQPPTLSQPVGLNWTPRAQRYPNFCFGCGKPGHLQRDCSEMADPKTVNKKLIEFIMAKPENSQGLLTRSNQKSSTPGNQLHGSQVTLLCESFFKKLDKELYPLDDLVLWHGGGGNMEYLGWTYIWLILPETFTGVGTSCEALVVVVPDGRESETVPCLVGTNTKVFRRLLQKVNEMDGSQPHTASPACRKIYSDIQTEASGNIGHVKVRSRNVTIPANESRKFSSIVRNRTNHMMRVLVESLKLPNQLECVPFVLTLPAHSNTRVQLNIYNAGDTSITLPRNKLLASVSTYVWCQRLQGACSTKSQPGSSNINRVSEEFASLPFKWGPVPEEWKSRLLSRMYERKHVFSKHEWDIGVTNLAEHRIEMTDETPFRERSRRISPGDLKDLREHLQKLEERDY